MLKSGATMTTLAAMAPIPLGWSLAMAPTPLGWSLSRAMLSLLLFDN